MRVEREERGGRKGQMEGRLGEGRKKRNRTGR